MKNLTCLTVLFLCLMLPINAFAEIKCSRSMNYNAKLDMEFMHSELKRHVSRYSHYDRYSREEALGLIDGTLQMMIDSTTKNGMLRKSEYKFVKTAGGGIRLVWEIWPSLRHETKRGKYCLIMEDIKFSEDK